jgi:ribonuclease HI
MAKQKYYVVWEGHKPGIYDSWDACKKQVDGYPQAKYKSFDIKAEAEKAFSSNYWTNIKKSGATVEKKGKTPRSAIFKDSLAVDAACSGNPGDMEYQCVHIGSGQPIFHMGPLAEGTNNIGEFLAIVHALAYLKQQNRPEMPIYTDSRNAMLWIKAKTCRTKLQPSNRNQKIFELIDRAEKWLAVNKITNPILKWETADWGEIPADFGRK